MTDANSSNAANPPVDGRSPEWAPAPSVTPQPPATEPAKVVYRYEYKDPYAPMSTRKQVLLGCAISLVVIAFMVAALLIGRG
ncbi:hypothetical protein NWF34_22610 [Gordonia sp. GONU]|uniref:hypothetical protein n=1 Tax=Gordonia sp. GONU TaxID=2972949 RepID=UPI0021ABEC7E|nr:hypothetical protein [Gordonia sp. GONU]MCR8899727.1 hypothetical protein [Gordonia sp. GONU]